MSMFQKGRDKDRVRLIKCMLIKEKTKKKGKRCSRQYQGWVSEEDVKDQIKWKWKTRMTDPNYLEEKAKEKKKEDM